MLFTGWIEKYFVEVSKTARGHIVVFFLRGLNQIRTQLQCCELDLKSVLFLTLFQVWLTNSQDYMTKYLQF